MGEMQDKSDAQLLRDYAERGCEAAFREIVTRHTDLVYSTGLRCVNAPDIAGDIAQTVFTDLSRKARSLAGRLADNASLVGWLYRSTRFAALKRLRDDGRRLAHERQAMEQLLSYSESAANWDRVRPVLDEAMDSLGDDDRDALLLRYFKNHDFRAVGHALGVSDDAAQKRVSRAVERLRDYFAKRGVTVGASGLAVVLSAHAVQAAPAALAGTLSSAALATAAAGSGTLSLLNFMATTKLKACAIGTIIAASAVTSVVIQQQSQARIRDADQALVRQAGELVQRQAEHERLANLAALAARPSANSLEELERLRNAAAALRGRTNELVKLREESRQLQASLSRSRPDPLGPNTQPTVLSEEAKARLEYIAGLSLALGEYCSKHDGRFPASLADTVPYFEDQITQATNFTADQFELVYAGSRDALAKYANPGSILLIRQRQPWKNTDGRWVKVYFFARGDSRLISVADGDFEAWEKEHILPPEPAKP
jgi:RNA polymerase sigma factor (sigma-70 family)